MTDGLRSVAVVCAGLAFVVFLLMKLLAGPARRDPGVRRVRERIADAKRRGSDHATSAELRAAALREAAVLALEELKQPSLAASYARRAERLDPHNADSVGLLAASMRRASRFVALERLLWRRLAEGEPRSSGYKRALDELIALYAGPLKRPEIAAALRRMQPPT